MIGIDVPETFARGGKSLIGFLSFCVMAYRMEPIFAYLAREFRLRPGPDRALALYDCFCAPRAPGRMRAADPFLPPRNIRFAKELEALRVAVAGIASPVAIDGPNDDPASLGERVERSSRSPHLLAPRQHFDFVLDRLSTLPDNPIDAAGRCYDPSLTPIENLPGRCLSQPQRAFVDNIWRPLIAPTLVGAGFWRVANLA